MAGAAEGRTSDQEFSTGSTRQGLEAENGPRQKPEEAWRLKARFQELQWPGSGPKWTRSGRKCR